jgi:GT2 family glycosyltransferase
MYRTGIIEEVGGFGKDFFCYFEDVDIGFRLRLAGYRFLLIPSAVVYHHGWATSGGQYVDFAVYYGHRNLIWTYIKNMPGILFWLFLPLHVFLNICLFSQLVGRKDSRIQGAKGLFSNDLKSLFKLMYPILYSVNNKTLNQTLVPHRTACRF